MINESLCSNLGLKWPAMVMVWCIVYCSKCPKITFTSLKHSYRVPLGMGDQFERLFLMISNFSSIFWQVSNSALLELPLKEGELHSFN